MKITILGSGAFALALEHVFKKNSANEVILFTAFENEYEALKEKHEITMDLESSLKDASLIIVGVPANAVREVLEKAFNYLNQNSNLIFISKGLEKTTNKTMVEVLADLKLDCCYGVLAGPTFASEITNDFPIALTLATTSSTLTELVKTATTNTYIELQVVSDVMGVEYCGVYKNVVAIIMGALSSKYDYISIKSYFLTKLIYFEEELLELLGCSSKTAFTYAGIGDLFLTGSSDKSRNYSYGRSIALNEEVSNQTIEGKDSIESFVKILDSYQIKNSLIHVINSFILKEISLDEVIMELKNYNGSISRTN